MSFELRSVLPAFALLAGLSACASDETTTRSGSSGEGDDDGAGDDSTAKVDAGTRDAGRKDAGKDARVAPPPVIKTDAGDIEGCAQSRADAELERGPVDIIITMDTSLSMAPQVCNVSTNLTAFAAGVGASSHVVSVY
jgi:hypothetical protein